MKIYLSGLAAEKLDSEIFDYSGTKDVESLLEHLSKIDALLNKTQLYVSVNENLASDKTDFIENDEVLVFNAFAGG